jgi:hypothetical protein
MPSHIPSKASARVSAFCAWKRAIGRSGLKRRAGAATTLDAKSYGSIASILKHGLDRAHGQYSVQDAERSEPIRHANIRGRDYYH